MQNKLADSLSFSVTVDCQSESCLSDNRAKQQHQRFCFELADIPRHMTLDQFLEYRILEELGWTWQGEQGELWCPSCSICWQECMYCTASFDRTLMSRSNIQLMALFSDPERGDQYICRGCAVSKGEIDGISTDM